MDGQRLTSEDQTSLIWLRMHWESDYTVTFDDGVWKAVSSRNPTDVLTADGPMQLRDQIKDHWLRNFELVRQANRAREAGS